MNLREKVIIGTVSLIVFGVNFSLDNSVLAATAGSANDSGCEAGYVNSTSAYYTLAKCQAAENCTHSGSEENANFICCCLDEGAAVPLEDPSTSSMELTELCGNIDDSDGKCASCASGGGLWTAVGCLPTNVEKLAPKLIGIMMGIGGLLLTIRILVAGAQIIFSSGDASALNKARTSIINSIIALLFIIFGATFLQIIGVKIFDIPGFFQ